MPRRSPLAILSLAVSLLGQGCGAKDGGAGPLASTSTDPPPAASAEAAASTVPASPPAPSTSASAAAPAARAPAEAPAGMVRVPEGIFLMGSPIGGSFEERPMHEVVLGAFWLDRTEVTMNAYAACVKGGTCPTPAKDNPFCNAHFAGGESQKGAGSQKGSDRGEHPVNCVDWNAAEAFCRFAGKRLPSEREWEYAARGGSERRTFSWGEEPADEQRACYKHPGGSCPVGTFAPGAFDLLDMNGNVWEWTSSWFGSYPGELQTGQYKVYRGGSWSRRFPKWLRNELRNRYRTSEHNASLGVRCAKTALPVVCPAETAQRDGRCERVSGVPTCETGFAWSGKACAPDASGGAPISSAGTSKPAVSTAVGEPAPSAPPEKEAGPIARSRTPQHDGDCQRNWPTTPAAYRWEGGTFHSRNPPIAAAGCQKRDMGRTWTSACCKT